MGALDWLATVRWRKSLGAKTLTVVYSAECKAARKMTREVTLLPVLVVLFVFSYAILTMLVVEQGQTIDSQRSLIREMLKDSNELAALKGKIAQEQRLHQKAMTSPSVGDQGKESAQTSNSPNGPAGDAKLPGKSRPMKEVPGRPASDLQDVRRSTRVI